jgi:hypothetical protein
MDPAQVNFFNCLIVRVNSPTMPVDNLISGQSRWFPNWFDQISTDAPPLGSPPRQLGGIIHVPGDQNRRPTLASPDRIFFSLSLLRNAPASSGRGY